MRVTRVERRLRNLQTLLLVGALLAALLAALVLALLGVPQPIAITISVLVYLACWNAVLRAIRRRRDAVANTDVR
jgi:uncharacterized membrane protein YgaE (UPF0421/DUF939 family)